MTFKQVLNKLNRRDTKFLPKNLTLTKLFLILFFSFTVVFSVKTLLAADTKKTLSKAFIEKQNAFKEGEATQENWSQELFSGQTMIGINLISGTLNESILSPSSPTTEYKRLGWQPQGLLGVTTNGIAMLYNPPVSGIEYIAQVKDNFLGKPTYAQSAGFQKMSAIIPLWKGFRNTTYVLFSIFFVAIGIMIMLRVKISQQATISIQSAIPKIITSLILVTFSYAIVGLIIDFSYLIEGLALSIIVNSSGTIKTSVADLLSKPDVFGKLFNMVPVATLTIWATVISGIITIVCGLATFGLGWWTGLVAFGVILFAILVFILWNTVKFFFGLLKCYVNIIIKTVIGPLEIALGAIPNMKMGFGSWFTDIVANIMVFPISIVFLVMIEALINATSGKSFWTPPGIDALNFWTASYASGGILPVALGLVGISILGKLPTLVPEIIFQIKPNGFGKAIGEGYKTPIGLAVGAGRQSLVGFGTKLYNDKENAGDATKPQKFFGWLGKTVADAAKKH